MRFLLLFSRQGKLGLQKWFTALSDRDKKIIRDITQMVLIVYRRSESCIYVFGIYICLCVLQVCELDIIF
uniref:AP complex mu/sigma subunit domain-containing protein n=1 Tax=Cyprinus carpio TaxID=7962 RepID=A0A8C2FK98_CYPCA